MRPESIFYYLDMIDTIAEDFLNHIEPDLSADLEANLTKWTMESVCYMMLDTRIHKFDPKELNDPNSTYNRILYGIKMFVKDFMNLRISQPIWSKHPKLRLG